MKEHPLLVSKILLLASILLLMAGMLGAAEIQDGKLVLEVLLAKNKELRLRTNDVVHMFEQNSAIQRELLGDIHISFADSEIKNYYGVIKKSQIVEKPKAETVCHSYFVWKDSTLTLQHEAVWFDDEYHHSYEDAKEYALANGYPLSRIHAIPMMGARLKVASAAGVFYFETPLRMESDSDITINGQKYGFSGSFILNAIGDKLNLIHRIELEEYIAGVIQNEIGSGAPLEALKAQAVATRTHALSLLLYHKHKNDGYDLCNDVHCQVYRGKHLLNENILKAVISTSGQVLIHNGKIVDATYHSSSGGKTDSSQNIWKGLPVPYLMGVTCDPRAEDYDLSTEFAARNWIETAVDTKNMSSWEKTTTKWTRSVSKTALMKNLSLTSLNTIEILARGVSGRILSIRLNGDQVLEGEYRIRQAFGALPSSLFYIQGPYRESSKGKAIYTVSDPIILAGKGSGHGVGMCQVTALQKAREGMPWDEIILFFYPGAELSARWREGFAHDE
ncbi:MAG: SpoIID/LytB domain-containing protein [Candidatus Cloacimonetes bacterium]|nr:SpoIID/LytB domain-containing protein [Candidatus Cloacimonadota bacterium]